MKKLILIAVILVLAVPAIANDAYVWGTGGSVGLADSKHSSVRMVSEKIEAKLEPNGTAKVRCTFVFKNEGGATIVKMGFPERALASEQRIKDFKSWVDGKPVQTSRSGNKSDNDIGYEAWHVKDISFAAGQTRTVVNTYTGGLLQSTDGKTGFQYVLKTGASWKGNIGEATITVDTSAVSEKYVAEFVAPEGYSREGSIIKWTLRDFEPAEDIDVVFSDNPTIIVRHKGDYWQIMPSILDARKNGTAMVSARGLQYLDLLGIGLSWRDGVCEISAKDKTLQLKPGSKTGLLNKTKEIVLPEAPYVRNGQVIVPAAAVIEALGGEAELVKGEVTESLIIAM